MNNVLKKSDVIVIGPISAANELVKAECPGHIFPMGRSVPPLVLVDKTTSGRASDELGACELLAVGVWTNTCCSHARYIAEEMDASRDAIGIRRAARRRLVHELGFFMHQVYSSRSRLPADPAGVAAHSFWER